MSKSNAPYPPEFRQKAVELVRRGDRTILEVAGELGISGQSLRNWVRQAEIDEGKRQGLILTGQTLAVVVLPGEEGCGFF